MAYGYWYHSGDFPSIDAGQLIQALSQYGLTKDAQGQALAQVRLATEAKRAGLKILTSIMKRCLKKSEVDAAVNPEKLALISWGPKANRQQA